MIRARIPAPETAIRPMVIHRVLAYVRTGSVLPVLGVSPTFTALLSMTGSAILCAVAGFILGSAFA